MNLDLKKLQSSFIICLGILAIGVIYATLASHWSQLSHMRIIDNPDIVGDTYVIHSFIYQHGSIADWRLTHAFFLFPDMMVIYLISLFVKHIYLIYPIYAFIQLTSLIIFTTLLFRTTTRTKFGTQIGFLAILCYFLWVIFSGGWSFYLYSCYDYISTALMPSFHFGSFVMEVASYAILIRLVTKNSLAWLTLLFILVVLTGISDPLYHYYFTFPAIVCLTLLAIFEPSGRRKNLWLVASLISMVIIWYLIYKYVPLPFDKISFKYTFPLFHLNVVVATAKSFFACSYNQLPSILWLMFFILAPISLIFNLIKKQFNTCDLMILFIYASIFISVLGLLTTNVKFDGTSIAVPIRYLTPFIVFPVIMGLPLIFYRNIGSRISSTQTSQIAVILLLICIMIFANSYRKPIYTKNLFDYYPQSIQCFDKHAKKLNLHNGIVLNWGLQNTYNAFNRTNTHFVCIKSLKTMHPYLWFSTARLFDYKNFDFIMMYVNKNFDKNKKEMIKRYGKPTAKFTCSGSNDGTPQAIFVYQNGALKSVSFEKYLK